MTSFFSDNGRSFVLENTGRDSAVFSFSSATAADFEVVVEGSDGTVRKAGTEAPDSCGTTAFADLVPDTVYRAYCSAGGDRFATIHFRTLTGIPADPHVSAVQHPDLTFAVISDPHLSLGRPNRRGRLLVESEMILRQTVAEAAAAGCDAILMPGDLTNSGRAEEAVRAADILSSFKGKVFAVPGDHDRGRKAVDGGAGFSEYFPATYPFSSELGGLNVIGLDTSDGTLDAQQFDFLERALREPGRALIISHYGLLNDPYIIDTNQAVGNEAQLRELLSGAGTRWIAYCGHKNVPSVLAAANGVQVHAPQPVHYPAGFLIVRIGASAIEQRFVPIGSEALREYSLRMLETAESPSYAAEYRYGTIEGRSFIRTI